MEQTKQHHTPSVQPEQQSGIMAGLSFRAAELLGLGATVASGAVAAWSRTREYFYRNIARYDVFKDLHDVREQKYKELYKHFSNKGQKENLIQCINKIESDYTAAVSERMQGLGITNSFDRWRTLKTHQKSEIVVSVAAVSAILMGAVVNLSASRRIRDKQDELSHRIEENEAHQR